MSVSSGHGKHEVFKGIYLPWNKTEFWIKIFIGILKKIWNIQNEIKKTPGE